MVEGGQPQAKKKKCHFFQKKIVYLGNVVSEQGIHTDSDKVVAVRNLQTPFKRQGVVTLSRDSVVVSPVRPEFRSRGVAYVPIGLEESSLRRRTRENGS